MIVERRELPNRLEEIRDMARMILARSRDLIEIDSDAIIEILVPRINQHLENQRTDNWIPAGSMLSLEQELGLNLFLNVINFCYKDPQTGREYTYIDKAGRSIKRATGLITALADSGVAWDNFAEILKLDEDRWNNMLQLSNGNILYLGHERRDRVVKMAKYALRQGPTTIIDYLESSKFNALNLVNNLSESGLFNDEFLKRAQLASRMISDVFQRRTGRPLFATENLTVMADYRIPQVFYNLGVVNLNDSSLMAKLMAEEPVESGSRYELSLRATAVSVGEVVAHNLGVIEASVDGYLWGLSQEMVKKGEMKIPHMLVATDAY